MAIALGFGAFVVALIYFFLTGNSHTISISLTIGLGMLLLTFPIFRLMKKMVDKDNEVRLMKERELIKSQDLLKVHKKQKQIQLSSLSNTYTFSKNSQAIKKIKP